MLERASCFLSEAWRPIGSLVLIGGLVVALFSPSVPKWKFDGILFLVGGAVLARTLDKAVKAKTQPGDKVSGE